MIKIFKSKTKLGETVKLVFQLTQYNRDEQLMKSLEYYLGCGGYFPRNHKNFGEFIVTKFNDLTEKVIPLFEKYPIVGVKALDFSDFCKVAELMKNKAHLTIEGLEDIRLIKAGMNRGRK